MRDEGEDMYITFTQTHIDTYDLEPPVAPLFTLFQPKQNNQEGPLELSKTHKLFPARFLRPTSQLRSDSKGVRGQ